VLLFSFEGPVLSEERMANGPLIRRKAWRISLHGVLEKTIGHQLSAINGYGPIAQLVRAHP
jgi:hypothetical protein